MRPVWGAQKPLKPQLNQYLSPEGHFGQLRSMRLFLVVFLESHYSSHYTRVRRTITEKKMSKNAFLR